MSAVPVAAKFRATKPLYCCTSRCHDVLYHIACFHTQITTPVFQGRPVPLTRRPYSYFPCIDPHFLCRSSRLRPQTQGHNQESLQALGATWENGTFAQDAQLQGAAAQPLGLDIIQYHIMLYRFISYHITIHSCIAYLTVSY